MSTAAVIRERPIPFTAEMVTAILAERKTQTRRMRGLEDVNSYPGRLDGESGMGPCGYRGLSPSDYYIRDKRAYAKNPGLYHWLVGRQEREVNPIPVRCPYGAVGDRLWVKENLQPTDTGALYVADGAEALDLHGATDAQIEWWNRHAGRNGDPLAAGIAPSIFMPRWASRITLEITDVRVQRVQEISEEDAKAEGVEMPDGIKDPPEWWSYRDEYAHLWDSINGKRAPWSSNPWCWVISFKRAA